MTSIGVSWRFAIWGVLLALTGCDDGATPAPMDMAEPLNRCGLPSTGIGFRQQAIREVASHDELVLRDLISWPDSLIGFVTRPSDGAIFGYGFGDRGDVMRATFSADGNRITDAIRTPMGPDRAGWWGSGGPVYHDAATGLLLMVTHHEAENLANAPFFAHVTLRMAKSTDWGQTWTNLGTIIDHEATIETDPLHALTMGNGGFVVRRDAGVDYFYVYHRDIILDHSGPGEGRNNLAVSRAPVAEVIQAAQAGKAPVFHKWNGTDWSQPGLRGRSIDLMPDLNAYGVVGDIDPFYVAPVGRYVAFYPSQTRGNVNPPLWNLLQSWSDDGIHWSPATHVYPEDLVGGDPIYAGVRAHNRVIDDCTAVLYRMSTTNEQSRWEGSQIHRVDLALERQAP